MGGLTRALVLAAAAALSSSFLVAACNRATQVELQITTDVPCTAKTVFETAVLVGPTTVDLPRSELAFVASTTTCEGGVVGSIVLVPSGSRDQDFRLDVVAAISGQGAERCRSGGAGCIIATRRLRYLEHEAVSLPIVLWGSCVGVSCVDPSATCARGVCTPSLCANPQACAQDEVDGLDAGGDDAGPLPLDAAVDAAIDGRAEAVACDGGADALVVICFRGRSSAVPCSLLARYLENGAKAGLCP